VSEPTIAAAQAQSPAPRGETTARVLDAEIVLLSPLARAFHQAVMHAISSGAPTHVRLLIGPIKNAVEVAKHCEAELQLVLGIAERYLEMIAAEDHGVREYDRRCTAKR
jgi:hypothetical protein